MKCRKCRFDNPTYLELCGNETIDPESGVQKTCHTDNAFTTGDRPRQVSTTDRADLENTGS